MPRMHSLMTMMDSSHLSSASQSRPDWRLWDLRAPGPIHSQEPVWCQVWAGPAGLLLVSCCQCWPLIGWLRPVLSASWPLIGWHWLGSSYGQESSWHLPDHTLVGSSVMIHAREWNKVFQEIEIILKRIRQKVPWIFLSHEQNLFKLRVILKARFQTHFLRWDTKHKTMQVKMLRRNGWWPLLM